MGGREQSEAERSEGAKPLRADARRNYERLVEAARKVFTDQGGGASMEAIAKQAGVGVGTLYRHFPKRIDVVEAVYRDDVDEMVRVAERGAETLEPWEALETWLQAYIVYARTKKVFLTELREAFDKTPELRVGSRERIVAAASEVLARAQAAGVARRDIDGEDLMQLFTSLCISSTLTDAQGERLLAVVLDGLRPPQD